MATELGPKQQHAIKAELRTDRGSRKACFLRMEGKLPGVIYGLGKDPVTIALTATEVVSVLQSGAHIMEIALDGKPEKMLIQDVQYDYLQTNVEHVDLMRIDPSKKVRVKVSLEFRGIPKGTKEGGILEKQAIDVEIECSPLGIPDSIRLNVENLEMHQMIHAREVPLPEGCKLVDYPEKIICQVRTVKEEVAAVAAEAVSTEPEVIGKKKEEEGAEGAAAPDAKGGAAKAAAPAAKK